MEKKFTWMPFYRELAGNLLGYKDRRGELLEIVRGLPGESIKYFGDYVTDVQPFLVFGIFNRSITWEKRKDICGYFKDKLQITSEIPGDFEGIPIMHALNSWWGDFEEENVLANWNLFEEALKENLDAEAFSKSFDSVMNQKGAKWNVTCGLFWLNPERFLPLDANTRKYLEDLKVHVLGEKELGGKNYLEFCQKVCRQLKDSFAEISYKAYRKGDSTMKEKTLEETLTLLQHSHNLILHGAPGTGKTYLAQELAQKMGANAAFVQFHPSYDYTDFVEGLRPVKSSDGTSCIGFERCDGVFKEFCKRALLSKSVSGDDMKLLNSSPTVWKVSLEGTGDNPTRKDCLDNGWIRIGWLDYGDEDFNDFEKYSKGGKFILKNFQHTMQVGDIVLSCWSEKEIDAIGVITGDYEYREGGGKYPRYRNVKWLVKGIREDITDMNHGKNMVQATIYKLRVSVEDVFKIVNKYSSQPKSNSQKPFLFIIDEINRGELSKIFGELFFAIDPGYRGERGRIQTQYQNLVEDGDIFKKGFYVPENVYIIGTMNDIDRSVDAMDFAFRRRFAFKEIQAEENLSMLEELGELKEEAKRRMANLNREIAKTSGLSSSYHIGGAYFLKLNELGGDFDALWKCHLSGLLQEYLRGRDDASARLAELKKAYDTAENP